ncbi:hypothetical protein [Alkalicoccus urumqiensis]|uniref:hypothetical protein n=1 Tax=Alkalicoccus urumqiensis TaxID=1548213 RepID=UPI0015E5CAAB|nr:hypothetical protein [Alkalicoccus urumqiensis]
MSSKELIERVRSAEEKAGEHVFEVYGEEVPAPKETDDAQDTGRFRFLYFFYPSFV